MQLAGVPPSPDVHSHHGLRRAQTRAPQHRHPQGDMQPAGVPPGPDVHPHQASRRAQTRAPQHPRPWHDRPHAQTSHGSDVHRIREELHFARKDLRTMSSAVDSMADLAKEQDRANMQLEFNNRSLQGTLGTKLYMANQKITELEAALESARRDEQQNITREKEISSLRDELQVAQTGQTFWMETCEQMKADFENELKKLKSTHDAQRSSELQQKEAECQKMVNQLQEQLTEKDNVIGAINNELSAISSELSLKQTELDQSVNKCQALEEKFKKDLTEQRKKSQEMILVIDQEISVLQESLDAQKKETKKVTDTFTKTRDQMKADFENELKRLKSTYDAQRSSDLQQMEAECQKKVNQLQDQITEKDDVINTARSDHLAISSELSLKQTELDQSINKCQALEEKFKEELVQECKRKDEIILEKDQEISVLQETLDAQKKETETVTDTLMKTCDQMKTDFENELKKLKSTYDTQRNTDLQQMETECQKKMNQLQDQITEKDDVINTARSDHLVISSELSLKQTELEQSINKCQALEEKFKEELAEREETSKTRLKEMEKLWMEKEEALKRAASKAEEDLKLVITENIRLQELALQNKKETKKEKKKKEEKGLTHENKQSSSIEEDEVTESPPPDAKRDKKHSVWRKQPKTSDAEAVVSVSQDEQQGDDRKKKRHGFWCRARKMMSRRSDTTATEGPSSPGP
ncbi:putative leucine-rich repeat-containing protein DDB_G0290503 isoform X1 [Mugil cephalus]|uniref:putative leucine-rich repeat-containing protein DDB_G0290503 isoform X1 n=1 Tax=Mugil cephalus TaxID=48193 RepID=UPI001FB6718D|nr:putative leucine-rich repeat-containing protein DDB_G0290503 isoform X1 [Mugil cephalus]